MPQLDTSTWFITIISMLLTLFILFQLKISKFMYPNMPESKPLKTFKQNTPWESKWTKIYSPLSLPQQ
uniref:ATP synthase complex subunit 8 n=8 Tax=Crocidura TaxID=36801 RepID=A0A0G2YJR0_9EUTH|nr:ATP synthase F0 subunit 8 [Crocidura palawanensis]YP_009144234.1 ATP synthase F0 subunit 8 [Crocidura ninoyi]YP_009144247.1 ATP synthase F0 subunit 8 [Crocidura negrina]YP_009144260.1 ATP synthase F0 subunit 8 [Crocidura panayensis]YP_009144286.1 ATP synthase F0 subunit 8 [Crocidura mindorus]YP_009144299.1 ATP synthase F0 subunit 8 [Crocidura beatus]AKI84700.1 ATP synthase F0 subunit 8 [Crocidura sp. JAE-2015]URW97159.1 ATP synthase F0 subunit 8 [Crocidura foetida doriae]URW97250.1 ATP s